MKNGNGKNGSLEVMQANLTAALLADEVQVNVEDLLPLLGKMGVKNPTPETVVPEAIAKNARLAVSTRNKIVAPALTAGKEPVQSEGQSVPVDSNGGEIEVSRKLKLSEIKDVAKATGLTQSIVKSLDQALHDRECQVLFLEGFRAQQREQEKAAALETGAIAARLQNIQQRDKALTEREDSLIEEGVSGTNHPTAIAKRMGFDLDSILSSIQETEEAKAKTRLSEEVRQLTLTEEEAANPFLRLAALRKQA